MRVLLFCFVIAVWAASLEATQNARAATPSNSASSTAQGPSATAEQRSHADALMAQAAQEIAPRTSDAVHKALATYQEALALWEKLGDESKQVEALLDIAGIYFFLHDTEAASRVLTKARDLARAANDRPAEASVLASFAFLHDSLGDGRQAIGEAGEGAAIWEAAGHRNEAGQLLQFQGGLFTKAKQLPEAINAYDRALALFRAAQNDKQEGITLVRLGQVHNLLQTPEAWEEAVKLFTEALPMLQSSQDRFSEGYAWWGLATAHDRLGHSAQARDAYSKALPLVAETKNASAQGQLLLSLGEEEDALKNTGKAISYYEQALPLLASPVSSGSAYIAHMRLGAARESLGRTAEALQAYQAAADLSHTAGNKDNEGTAKLRIGTLRFNSGERQTAIDADREAFEIFRVSGNTAAQGSALAGMSAVYQTLGEYKKALDCGLQALPLVKAGSSAQQRAAVLMGIGESYSALHESKKALDALRQALALYEKDSVNSATILTQLAEVHSGMGDQDSALAEANEALKIYRSAGQAAGEAKALNDLGTIYEWKGDRAKAESAFQQALDSARKRNAVSQQAGPLNNLAQLSQFFGDNQRARELYEQSLALNRQTGDADQEATILSNLGMVYHALGDERKAFDTLNAALNLRRVQQNRDGEAKTLSDLGLVYGDTGDPQKALEVQTRALALLEGLGDPATEASLLNNMGTVYRSLGANDLAEHYFLKSLEVRKDLDDDYDRSGTLNNLAVLAQVTGEKTKALGYYKQSLKLAERVGNKIGQSRLLSSQAMIYSDLGDQQQALKNLEHALQLSRETADIDSQALATHNLGTLHDKLGDPQHALNEYNEALGLWRQIGRVDGEAQTHFVRAKTERKLGNLDGALRDVDQSIGLSESVRSRIFSDDLRASFLSSAGSYYELKIALLMRLARQHPTGGFDVKAFETSEQARARSLLDLLTESHADIRSGVAPELITRERAIERSLNAKATERRKLDSSRDTKAQAEQLEREIQELTAEYQRIEAQIRTASPGYAALTQAQPLTLPQVQRLLDTNTLLIEYSLGQESSYVWAVGPQSFVCRELPKRADIEADASDYHDLVSRNARNAEAVSDAASRLSATLLGPIRSELPRKRLVIIADGALQQYVSFAALPEPSDRQPDAAARPLMIQHEVLNEPSASAVAILRRDSSGRGLPPKTVAVFADPVFQPDDERLIKTLGKQATNDPGAPQGSVTSLATKSVRGDANGLARLPRTGEEAKNIVALTKPGQALALLDFKATKLAAENPELANYRIVHFATHGLIDAEHPQLSGLVLSQYNERGEPVDGFLRLNEIFNLKLPVQLVVLSACQSGQGKMVSGEGLVGLTRGFMYAGAPSVVVSLWNVDDAATSALMTRFYKGLLGTGHLRPAAALRAAQRSLIEDPKWNQPYYWAAFTVQGEWR